MIKRSTSGFRGAIFSDKKNMEMNRIVNWFRLWLIAVSGRWIGCEGFCNVFNDGETSAKTKNVFASRRGSHVVRIKFTG